MEPSTLVVCIVAFLILYTAYGVIYCLFLSPVAQFPGRKLAALTFWYEFHFDVVKRGCYVWQIKRMHETYVMLTTHYILDLEYLIS